MRHILRALRTWTRGIRLLRSEQLVSDLGKRHVHLQTLHSIHQQFPGTRLSAGIVLKNFEPGRLQMGSGVSVGEGTILSFGDQQNGYGSIHMGCGTWVGEYNNLRTGGGQITIGSGCLISQFCTLVATSHGTSLDVPIQEQAPPAQRGIILGDDVWLGAGVTVTPGVEIGRGAVIGAGAVVTCPVPDHQIWAGIPARRIGQRS